MSLEDELVAAIEGAAARRPDRPLVVGLCGAQGSGKSTLVQALTARIARSEALSLDDLYLTRARREALAFDIHPLLRTRGVPGTHDVALGLSVFDSFDRGEAARLPRFDKASDDRRPENAWPILPADTRILLFEGWCVGAVAEAEAALIDAVNALEREHDRERTWRRYVNAMLAGPYRMLFDRVDLLVLLAAPDWDVVLKWRLEQERALRRDHAGDRGVMNDAEVAVFVSHYERLTRHILSEMPDRADIVVELDQDRRWTGIRAG